MLKIRKEQRQVCQEDAKNKSIRALCQHLKQSYHYTRIGKLSDQELSQQVSVAVDIAVSYGLKSKSDINGFVTIDLTRCPGFYKQKQVQDLLKDPQAHPNMRMIWLAQKLPSAIWAELS